MQRERETLSKGKISKRGVLYSDGKWIFRGTGNNTVNRLTSRPSVRRSTFTIRKCVLARVNPSEGSSQREN